MDANDELAYVGVQKVTEMSRDGKSWTEISRMVKEIYGDRFLENAYAIYKDKRFLADFVGDDGNEANMSSNDVQNEVEKVLTLRIDDDLQKALFKTLQERGLKKAHLGGRTKNVLFTVSAFLVLALLFPPYQLTVNGLTISMGFKFLFAKGDLNYEGVVNVPYLMCEIFVILVVGWISFILARDKDSQ